MNPRWAIYIYCIYIYHYISWPMDAYAYEWMNMDDHDVTLNEAMAI